MLASELINKLQEIMNKEGDNEVLIDAMSDDTMEVVTGVFGKSYTDESGLFEWMPKKLRELFSNKIYIRSSYDYDNTH